VTSVNEDGNTPAQGLGTHLRVADIVITDDPFGTDQLYLTGADAASFEIVGTTRDDQHLYVKVGVVFNHNVKTSYAVTVNVFDANAGSNPAATAAFTLNIVQIAKGPLIAISPLFLGIANGTSTASPIFMSHATITDLSLGTGTNLFTLSGANAALFQLNAVDATHKDLYLQAGAVIANNTEYFVTVNARNASFAPDPFTSQSFALIVGAAGAVQLIDTSGSFVVPIYNTLTFELWGGGAGAAGDKLVGTSGTATTVTGTGAALVAGGGLAPPLGLAGVQDYGFNGLGGVGGTASGGDINTAGINGGNGVIAPAFVLAGAGYSATFNAGDGGGHPGSAAVLSLAFIAPGAGGITPAVYVNGGNGINPGDGGGGSANMQAQPSGVTMVGGGINITGESLLNTARPGAGQGAYCKITYTVGNPNALAVGTNLTLVIGAAGVGGAGFASGGNGFHGRVKITVA
jgi:hypothetical protein